MTRGEGFNSKFAVYWFDRLVTGCGRVYGKPFKFQGSSKVAEVTCKNCIKQFPKHLTAIKRWNPRFTV